MRPLLVLLVKATYTICPDGLKLAKDQAPIHIAGIPWGKPEESSYRYEPECAFIKLATDIVLVGHGWAPSQGTREIFVSLSVGPAQKSVRVVGDRTWYKRMGFMSITKPQPFERMPLIYERAFGGWDRSQNEFGQNTFEPFNPVGVGFRSSARHFEEGLHLPNLEDPHHLLEHFGQRVPPAGFGFLSPHWHPRAAFAGTYDETWDRTRKPLLPTDFDRRFFNAASPGLVAPGYLQGNEPVVITNASPRGTLAFSLPGQAAPVITVERLGVTDVKPEMRLDTVILDTDAEHVLLLWRGHLLLFESVHEVQALHITSAGVS
ncbi:DUF2169 family type VI secretion system accessory protein [Hyalangium rubrum]|uniref:DUF2169 domain-containing protein n=1 Tax=Hyalangium rubrum TaxID=3103134 RepID=A0ABU5HCU1_9BACT|nr:DUF2169 domain-containing protein [Hyalangium sp. s54d21]MDY7230919.1 DUF2169 domain-containing protein [Hyalangium sp. s54d21]